MEILGIGPMELILILIIALMVFGPDKLPEVGAKLGKGLRGMREATREFSREIEETRAAIEAPIKEVTEPFNDVRQAAQAISNPGAALRQAVVGEINAADAAARAPAADAQTGTVVSGDAPAVSGGDPSTEAAATPLPYAPSAPSALPAEQAAAPEGYTADQFFPRPVEPEPTTPALVAEPSPAAPAPAAPAPAAPVNGRRTADDPIADANTTETGASGIGATGDDTSGDAFDEGLGPEADEAPVSRAALARPTQAQPVAPPPAETAPTPTEPASDAAPTVAAQPEPAPVLPAVAPDNLDLPALPAPEE